MRVLISLNKKKKEKSGRAKFLSIIMKAMSTEDGQKAQASLDAGNVEAFKEAMAKVADTITASFT